jgi:hypothetical protein
VADEVKDDGISIVVQFEKISKRLSFRSAVLWREESAASLQAVSRFLADRPASE